MASKKLPPDLEALISLLDDPDTEAFRHIREQISALGPKAVAPLEAAWEHAFDPMMQRRIEELVHHIQFDQMLNDFTAWIDSGSDDLFTGYLLITRYQYPDLNEMKVKAQFEHLLRDIWLELNENLTSLEKVKVLNHIFFLVYKYGGASTGKPAPENYYLNIMMESRQGTPLSLGILYLMAAQRLGIPLQGVDLPKHFILAHTNKVAESWIAGIDALEVRFYINPFAKGAVFSRKELSEYLTQIELEPQEKYYLPCANIQIISRLIEELQVAYRLTGNEEKSDELNRLRDIINR